MCCVVRFRGKQTGASVLFHRFEQGRSRRLNAVTTQGTRDIAPERQNEAISAARRAKRRVKRDPREIGGGREGGGEPTRRTTPSHPPPPPPPPPFFPLGDPHPSPAPPASSSGSSQASLGLAPRPDVGRRGDPPGLPTPPREAAGAGAGLLGPAAAAARCGAGGGGGGDERAESVGQSLDRWSAHTALRVRNRSTHGVAKRRQMAGLRQMRRTARTAPAVLTPGSPSPPLAAAAAAAIGGGGGCALAGRDSSIGSKSKSSSDPVSADGSAVGSAAGAPPERREARSADFGLPLCACFWHSFCREKREA